MFDENVSLIVYQSRLTRKRDDNRAIRSEDEERKRERKEATFFDMGIYFRPISDIPRRKYPPRSSADCITRRGMRRTEIEKRKKLEACVKKRQGMKEKGTTERKGEVRREREREEDRAKTRRHATLFSSMSVFCSTVSSQTTRDRDVCEKVSCLSRLL